MHDLSEGLAAVTAGAILAVVAYGALAMARAKAKVPNRNLWICVLLAAFMAGASLALSAAAQGPQRDIALQALQISTFVLAAACAWAAYRRAPHALIANRAQIITQDLQLTTDVLAAAIGNSPISVLLQDKELRYTFIQNPPPGCELVKISGKGDADILDWQAAANVMPLKKRAIENGEIGRAQTPIRREDGVRWYDLTVEPLKNLSGEPIGVVTMAYDITKLKENEERLTQLMREVTHRSKNLLAVIQAIAGQTAHRAGSVEDYVQRFSGRLRALSDAHDMLLRNDWAGAAFGDLMSAQLAMLPESARSRVRVKGERMLLRSEAAQNMCLTIHELVTNAITHGALSTDTGLVKTEWALKRTGDGPHIEFRWCEEDGPPVSEPERAGFGLLMVETVAAKALNAVATLNFHSSGLDYRIEFPAQHLA
ncbi:MAG: HWE histidine kinase domain-containing protein [Hyphomicrobiales bacterium]|nr:HWE histidine kinase domain-containing protein [Hyphomicrobiales bacterium]